MADAKVKDETVIVASSINLSNHIFRLTTLDGLANSERYMTFAELQNFVKLTQKSFRKVNYSPAVDGVETIFTMVIAVDSGSLDVRADSQPMENGFGYSVVGLVLTFDFPPQNSLFIYGTY